MGQVNGRLGIIIAAQHLTSETAQQRFDFEIIAIKGCVHLN